MVNKKRKIQVKDLNEHLICPLCKGYLIDATSITECLHTFCRSCIRKQLNIRPACPTCHKIHSKFLPKSSPKLRHDRILQSLVYKIVPDLYQRELANRTKFIETHSGQDDRIVRWSDEVPRDKKRFVYPGFSKDEIFSICLKRQTGYTKNIGDGDIQSFLSCPGHVCIAALKKFILLKLGLLKDWQVLFFNALDSFSDSCTLVDIAYIKRWDRLSPLILDYYLINPNLNGLQLTRSTAGRKRPRNEQSTVEKLNTTNNSVRITESSPTSGIKIRIRLSDSIRQERITTRDEEVERNYREVSPRFHIKQEISSPLKDKEQNANEAEGKKEEFEDFQPPAKKIRFEEGVKSGLVNSDVNKGTDHENNSNKSLEPVVTDNSSSKSKKKRGRPKRTSNTHGKLSILSLLKRRWSQEPQIKKECPTSPDKYPDETSGTLDNIETGHEAAFESDVPEPTKEAENFQNGGNTSIVTFREDNTIQPSSPSKITPKQDSFSQIIAPPAAPTANIPITTNSISEIQVNNQGMETDDTSKNCKNVGLSNPEVCEAQLKYPDMSMLSQSADFQRFLLQSNLFALNPDIMASYNQKLCELISSQNPCVQKPLESMFPLQQNFSPIQFGGNLAEGTTGMNNGNGETFPLGKPLQMPEYLNSILLGQQVPQMLLSYPQLPLQSLVVPQGFEYNLMQNILASNQKTGLETALTPEQISSLTVPLSYNFVYPSGAPQYIPDCTNFYMGQALHQHTNPFENTQILSKPNFHEIPQCYTEEKILRNKSFLPNEGMPPSMERPINQIEGINGCAERPLFSPMSVDEDDKRVGLIPESALDPSKEIGAEKCDILLNGSRTSDISV